MKSVAVASDGVWSSNVRKLDPYSNIAALYDAEFDGLEADAAFYARHAGTGRKLVLGCGTGRVCRALAGEVVGLDLSEPMLARARTKGGSATYVAGDMRDFDLGRFDEIIVPNAAFAFLPTRADQAACLASCKRALGGPLWLDLPMPDPRWLGEAHTPERPAWEGMVDGRAARRTREVFRRPVAQALDLVDRYFVDGAPVATSTLNLRLVFPAELEWMLEACGFWVDALFGDHLGGPIREGCPRLIARAFA